MEITNFTSRRAIKAAAEENGNRNGADCNNRRKICLGRPETGMSHSLNS